MIERLDTRYSPKELKIELDKCDPSSRELADEVSSELVDDVSSGLTSNRDSPIESSNSSTLNRIGHKT